jgi:glucosylceramidase
LKAGAQGWIDWNLLLDERGGPNHLGNDCDAALMANVSSGELHLHPQYWYVAHFSKYLPPGSRLLAATVRAPPTGLPPPLGRPYGTCGAEDGFEAASFLRPDGQVATIILNCAGAAQRYVLKSGGLVLPLEIPPHAIHTLVHAREVGMDVPERQAEAAGASSR